MPLGKDCSGLLYLTRSRSVSGGHINPAVTMAFVLLRKISPVKGAAYVFAQLSGAILGSAILRGSSELFTLSEAGDKIFAGGAFTIEQTVNKLAGTIGQGLLVEAMFTFLLVFVVLHTAVRKGSAAEGGFAPIAIGFAVFLAHIVAIPLTGTGINPARSFGPAVVSGYFTDLWVYFLGPAIGSTFAVGAYALLGM